MPKVNAFVPKIANNGKILTTSVVINGNIIEKSWTM